MKKIIYTVTIEAGSDFQMESICNTLDAVLIAVGGRFVQKHKKNKFLIDDKEV